MPWHMLQCGAAAVPLDTSCSSRCTTQPAAKRLALRRWGGIGAPAALTHPRVREALPQLGAQAGAEDELSVIKDDADVHHDAPAVKILLDARHVVQRRRKAAYKDGVVGRRQVLVCDSG